MIKPICIASIFSVMLFSCKERKEEIVMPIFSPITEAVFAPGHIETKDQFTLTATSDGYIKELRIKEGDSTHSGQILIVQDYTVAAVQQQMATENLHITQQQAAPNSPVLNQLLAQLNAANQKLEVDKAQLERMQRLYATNSVSKVDIDNAGLSYDNTLSQISVIRQNIEATKLNLEQSVVNSKGQLATAVANRSYYNISSPGNYKVYSLLKKKGDFVRKGEAVAIMGNSDTFKVVMNIDEVSISKIRAHQVVLIELNTEKGKTYTAKISRILPSFDINSQSYTAEAIFDTVPTDIINGTLLQANIIVAKKGKAMLIPRVCLSADEKVFVKRKGKTDTLSIQAGIISNEWVEVLSGIHINDKIIKQ